MTATKERPTVRVCCSNPSCILRKVCKTAICSDDPKVNHLWRYFEIPQGGKCDEFRGRK